MSRVESNVTTDDGLRLRPLRRVEYEALVLTGSLDHEHVELLDGWLVEMSPEGPAHHWIITRLAMHLARRLPQGFSAHVGHPWSASDVSQPEPDLAVIADIDHRIDEHPRRAELVIEVAFSSRGRDLGRKARIYGAAGAPTYWVVDLRDHVVHVHTEPSSSGYRRVTRVPFATTLAVMGVDVNLATLLEAGS